MEKEQELEWLEAQKIVISEDLVAVAKMQLQFLAVVDKHRCLYDGPTLQKAIYRYNACWLPLLAKHSESQIFKGPLVVPVDCEWIWHCHRLNPVRYKTDCEDLYGRILDNYNVVSSVQGASTSETEEIWNTMYPNEPYLLDLTRDFSKDTSEKISGCEKHTKYDLVSAVKRQSPFCYQVSRPHMNNQHFLEGAVARYKGFLYLIKRNRERSIKCFCVPTYDIDLIWHSHQLHPVSYCKDLCKLVGKVLEHDDMDSDRTKGKKLDVGFSETTKQWEETFGSCYWRAGAMHRGSAPSPLTTTPYSPNMMTKKVVAPYDCQKIIQLPEVKVVEVLLEIVGVKNLPVGHKGSLFVSFSKTQPDTIFNAKRRLTIFSESGEKQVASFQCEPTGELLFQLISHSPSNLPNLPIPRPSKKMGSTSLSLREFLSPISRLSVEKWLELVPSSGNVSAKPICLRIAISFTVPAIAPRIFHTVCSRPFLRSSCFFPLPGRIQHAKRWTRVIDEAGSEVISLQMRDSKKGTARDTSVSRREVIGVTTSLETITLAEFIGTGWSLMDYNWCLKFEKKSGKDGHLFELVGNRMVKIYPGRKLEFEHKHCERQKSDHGFLTAVEFSAEVPYGRAVALLDLKSGFLKVNEEWLVLPGIILVFILSDILRKEGCDSFTVSEGNLKETENLSGCYEDEKPNLSNTMGLEVESKMEGPEGNAVMPEEGRSHSGGCGSGCGGGCGNMSKSGDTIIHMYGKRGQHDLAFQLYSDMKLSGRSPDAVTYTVLIDSLGKANMIKEAAEVMSEMLNAGVKPTLRTFSALICGYAKAGKRVEAEETFDCMLRSGIKPDHLAYSVMLDILLRFNESGKAMKLYQEMVLHSFKPDHALYEVMLRVLGKENREEDVHKVVKDMEELCGMNSQVICSILVKGECFDHAANMLRLAISQGCELDRENLLSILGSYGSSGRHLEARELLDFLREHSSGSHQLINEALIIMLCKAHQLGDALREYGKARDFGLFCGSFTMYESLLQCCEENELFAEASQIFSDMRFYGVEPSDHLYRSMVVTYCKMGFPETAHYLIDQAEEKGLLFDDVSIHTGVIEAYGKLKLWQKAESLVGSLRQKCTMVDRKVWNALIHAYAASGCYERARAIFNTMMRDGPSPTVDSVNGLMQALIVDGRLDELYVVIQELQDMGFKISKSSITLMLDAFAHAGNIFEVKKIYQGMKAAGYFPTMHLYRIMIGLLAKGKRVRDVEAMVSEMEVAGFKPDLSIWNSVLKLYTGIGDFKKMGQVYQLIQEAGLKPDEDTYNTLILMYCRDRRPEEGLSLMHEMRRVGLEPKLDTYKSLISAFGKLQMVEQAEELFEGLLSKECKLDRSFYHIMMKMFRNSGNHSKAEKLLGVMKEAGVEPTIATMHLLMVSYSGSGQPEEAEKVLDNLKVEGLPLSTLLYSSVIDAYLKNGDHNVAIQKLVEMKKDGLEPDHRIWTCFVRAASLSQHTSEAIVLLKALRDTGFDLPIRLLTEKSDSLVSEVDNCLEKLGPLEDNAAFNFVNALEDLLWAFELRATASWVFQLAVKRSIYRHDVFRVAEKDWGADFRKMSAGSALVGLTLWLDHMQDASLQGYPLSPKSVVLITGTAEYNMVSLNSTLKAFLWEMGSPFLPCKTRSGLLVAKAHSLRMWLKDSSFCLDLELKDAPSLPESNSMQLMEGCFLRRGLVPAFKDITERLGDVRPKKFARLALLPDEKRDKVIRADIEGGKEKLEKMKKKVGVKRRRKLVRRKFIRGVVLSKPVEIR